MRLQDCPAGPVLDKAVALALGTAEVKSWSTDLITAWELVELHHIGIVPMVDGRWWSCPHVETVGFRIYYGEWVDYSHTADAAPLAVVRRFLYDKLYTDMARGASDPSMESVRDYLLGEDVDPSIEW